MTSSGCDSPKHCSGNLTPSKRSAERCLDMVPYADAAAAVTDVYEPNDKECLAAQPLGPGIPLAPANPVEKPKRRRRSNRGDPRVEIHRRQSWVPLGWTVWKIIRTAGKSEGHVDVYYYTPDGKDKVRSKKGVFHLLVTGRKLGVNENAPDYATKDFEFDVPKEMKTWYGPEAGVSVQLIDGYKLLPEDVKYDGVEIPMLPPISVKRVRVPAGTRYRQIDALVAKPEPDEVVAKADPDEAVAKAESDEAVAKADPDEVVAKAESGEAVAKAGSDDGVLQKAESREVVAKAESGEGVEKADPDEVVAKADPDEAVEKAESGEVVAKAESGEVVAVVKTEPLDEV